MIRKNADRKNTVSEKRFGGEGLLYSCPITNTNEELMGKGRLFSHNVLMPGASIGNHTHKGDMEIYYILSGKGEYNDNGKIEEVQSGDIIFCQDGETHGIKNIGSTALEMIALIIYA